MTVNYQPSSADELLSVHSKRIELIRQCANESSEKEFQRKWFSVLLRCAQWFSSVPLTPELHREPGGAFRATIEIARQTSSVCQIFRNRFEISILTAQVWSR